MLKTLIYESLSTVKVSSPLDKGSYICAIPFRLMKDSFLIPVKRQKADTNGSVRKGRFYVMRRQDSKGDLFLHNSDELSNFHECRLDFSEEIE